MKFIACYSLLTLWLVIGASLPGVAFNSSPKIYNHTGVFLTYWDQHKNDPPQNQVAQFKAKVAPAFPAFYEYKFESWKRSGKNPDDMLANLLGGFSQIESTFRTKSCEIARELRDALRIFVSIFPDMKTDFEVHIVHSLGEMDGGIRTLKGQPTFIFGVDNIIKYHHGKSETAFFHHELFHKYHFQYFKGEDKIWAALWGEGLATFASEDLNPNSSLAELGLDTPKNLVNECQARRFFLFKYVLENLDSNSESIYESLFLLSSGNLQIPKRAGYYIGYLVAKEMAKTRSLSQLSRLDGPELRNEIEKTLRKLGGI